MKLFAKFVQLRIKLISVMKIRFVIFALLVVMVSLNSCKQKEKKSDMNIIYLHHSTGGVIWQGEKPSIITRAARKISTGLADALGRESQIAIVI